MNLSEKEDENRNTDSRKEESFRLASLLLTLISYRSQKRDPFPKQLAAQRCTAVDQGGFRLPQGITRARAIRLTDVELRQLSG